jgi:hypothetical protein
MMDDLLASRGWNRGRRGSRQILIQKLFLFVDARDFVAVAGSHGLEIAILKNHSGENAFQAFAWNS